MGIVTALHGHTSPETAYNVADYPYGFRLRCQIRYWLETTKKGTRFVSQTTNPKIVGRVVWNKPKASTYALAAGMYLDEEGHVTWTGVHMGSGPAVVSEFLAQFPEEAANRTLRTHVLYSLAVARSLAAHNANGQSGWTMNGVDIPAKPGDLEKHTAEVSAWESIAGAMGSA